MSAEPPDVTPLLGPARKQWDALLKFLGELDGVVPEWKFYGEKYGWQLKLKAKGRALVYLIPRPGRFTAALALRKPAIAALRAGGIPEELVREIEAAKEAPEGKPARVEVSSPRTLALLKKLLVIKL